MMTKLYIYNFEDIKDMFNKKELLLYLAESDIIIIDNLARLKLKPILKFLNKKIN